MTGDLKKASPTTPSARRKAREMLLQSLYQWELAGQAIHSIEAQFYAENNMDKVDRDYYHELLHGIPAALGDVDDRYASLLDRRVDELDPISLSILRIGSYEMAERVDVPFKVVINEAVNLAKKFGPEDSQKYVNAVMDRLAPRHRKTAVEAARNSRSSAAKTSGNSVSKSGGSEPEDVAAKPSRIRTKIKSKLRTRPAPPKS